MSEEQLKSIGIPLGPRMRILQEARHVQQLSPIQMSNGYPSITVSRKQR